MDGLKKMVTGGVICKVNSVYIKGINDTDIPRISMLCSEIGVNIGNITGLLLTEKSVFDKENVPNHIELCRMRENSSLYLNEIMHCKQCRADASGGVL